MKTFFSALLNNLITFPQNVISGLAPGSKEPSATPHVRMRRNFVFHIHPVQVRLRTLRLATTLGLGVITLTLSLILIVSGMLLMIYYTPSTQEAYNSMQDIQYAVAFGAFTRALHRWAAHGMVICLFLHFFRVAATAGYFRRELSWQLGLGLGIFTLGLAFTGYLLPWDQRSFWAVSVTASMLDHIPLIGTAIKALVIGGDTVTQSTLLRFYLLHVALLPALLLLFLALHFWRIRKDGGLALSVQERTGPTVPCWPHLILREVILILLVLIVFSGISLCLEAPLGSPVNPHTPSNPEKAPWYFLWIQEMVSYSAIVGGVVFPFLLLLGLGVLPFLDREEEAIGRWWGTNSSRGALAVTVVFSVIFFVLFEVLYISLSNNANTNSWWTDLLNPATGMIGLALVTFIVVGIVVGSTRAAMFCGLVVMLVAVVGCTAVGLCRGPDWIFYWPWEEWLLVV